MPWTYTQSTGRLEHDGELVGIGYAGREHGLNNPAAEAEANIGPLPAGTYTIEKAIRHPQLGPITMPLTPNPANEMFGRSLFRLHGDNSLLNHSASHGCIILARNMRNIISASKDRVLIVKAA